MITNELDFICRRHGMDESHLKTDVVQRNFMETYRHMSKNHPHFGSLSHVDSKEWWLKIVHGAFKGNVWVEISLKDGCFKSPLTGGVDRAILML